MATVDIYSTQGDLRSVVADVIVASSPYVDLTYETRIENVLNYYQTINELVSIDYSLGGYLNYGLLSDGRFAVDLDNYQLRFSGTSTGLGSTVNKIEALDLSTNIKYTIEGSLNYSGAPFFTSIDAGSKITSIGSFTSNYEYARISLDGTYSENGNITGTLKGISSGYVKSDVAYLEVLEGGSSPIDRIDGIFDIPSSGTFSKLFVGTISTDSGDAIDYISSENITFPLNKKITNVNLFEGDDSFTLTGSMGSAVYANDGNDVIEGSNYSDNIFGELGNDSIEPKSGDDTIDGGPGYDIAIYETNRSSITSAIKDMGGIITLRTEFGTDTLINIEEFSFQDGSITTDNLITQYSPAVYQTNIGLVTANIYTGAVDFLEFELLGSSTGDVVTGSASNDFINLLGGDDAANGGDGQDVLDGGTGSNFLTGGSGADTFFLDGRSGTTTWSTITDFTIDDSVNIWGWQDNTSQLILALENQGADGFKGATFHYDLNGDNLIDTSITFSGLVLASLPGPSSEEVAGNGYILFS